MEARRNQSLSFLSRAEARRAGRPFTAAQDAAWFAKWKPIWGARWRAATKRNPPKKAAP